MSRSHGFPDQSKGHAGLSLKSTINCFTRTCIVENIKLYSTATNNMVQNTGTNNIGRDQYTIPLNFNNGPVPECALIDVIERYPMG